MVWIDRARPAGIAQAVGTDARPPTDEQQAAVACLRQDLANFDTCRGAQAATGATRIVTATASGRCAAAPPA